MTKRDNYQLGRDVTCPERVHQYKPGVIIANQVRVLRSACVSMMDLDPISMVPLKCGGPFA